MPAKETVLIDKACSQALVYFYAMSRIRIHESSIELLCSKDYDTPWCIKDKDNWTDYMTYPINDDIVSMN